jgi:hypothetical protein
VVVAVAVAVAVAVVVAKLEKTRIPPSLPLQLLLPSSLLLLPPWFWRVPPPPSNVTAENSGFLPDFETTGMKNSLPFRKCPAMKRKRTFLWSGLVHAIAHCRQLLTLPNPIPLPQAVEQDGPLLLTCISSPP